MAIAAPPRPTTALPTPQTRFRPPSSTWLPWLAAALLALPAAAPLFGPGLIGTHRYGDSPFLLIRTVAVVDALRNGTLFPRWSPELAYGLGYPLFDFYGSLAFYGAALLHLAGLEIVDALKVVQLLAFVGGAVAMYALARRHLGTVGGLVAAAAYADAPYHLVNVYARGDSLGEFTALAILPALLLAIEIAAEGRFGGALAAALLAAALVGAHNLSGLLGLPVLALWGAWALARRLGGDRLALARGILCLGFGGAVGLGLSAFYWLPALADRRYVHFEHNTTGYFDFRNHFLGLGRLVQPGALYDYALDGTPDGALPFQIGLAQALAAIVGLVVCVVLLRRANRSVAVLAGVAALSGLGYTALATPLARPLWELLPPLQIAQFPWRALGPASLGLALMAALPARLLPGRARDGWAVAVIAAVVVGGSLGANPERWRIPAAEVDAAGARRYEYLTSSIGSTVRAEYLPEAARERPWTSSYVTSPGAEPLRMLPNQGAEVVSASRRGMGFVVDVRAGDSRPLVFEQHWFPGWRATVDGESAAIWPSEPEGYITVGVPSGQHRLELVFGETPLRRAADLVSIGSLALVLALGFTWARRRGAGAAKASALPPEPASTREGQGGGVAAFVTVMALLLFVARVPWAELAVSVPIDGWDHRFAYVHAPWAYIVPGGVPVGPSLIVGYRQPAAVTAGQSLPIELAVAGSGGRLRARLISPAELILGGPRALAEATVETWAGSISIDLPVPVGSPPGLYQVQLAAPGAATRDWLLAPILVRPPAGPTPAAAPLARFGRELALESVGLAADASAAHPAFRIGWRAAESPTNDWRVSARLVDDAGHTWAAADGRPADGFYPTRLWRSGASIVERRDLVALRGTPPGRYRLEVRVYSLSGQSLDVLDERGAAAGPTYRSEPFDLAAGPAPGSPAVNAPAIDLLEAVVGGQAATAGDPVPVSLLFRVGAPPGRRLDARITFGGATVTWPLGDGFGAERWRAGEVVRQIRDITSPRTLAAGEYPLSVEVIDPGSGRALLGPREIGRIRIKNRPRRFDLPPFQHPVGARFGDAIELIGWSLGEQTLQPGGKLRLTLYWRAAAETAISYTVFTHLLDADNRVRGQLDAVPGGGSLPTSGWAIGEVVEDRYEILLDAAAPPGRYAVEVGLYEARSGQRLAVTSGAPTADHLVLTTVDAVR